MHRTEGLNNVNNLFVDNAYITDDWMNSVQEEICNVIEHTNATIQQTNDYENQLSTAIKKMIKPYQAMITNQAEWDAIIQRASANNYQFKDEYKTIFVKSGTYTLTLSGGDSYGILSTNLTTTLYFESGAALSFGDTIGYLKINTTDAILTNVKITGTGSSAVAVTTSFLLDAPFVTFNNCMVTTRYSNTTMYGFQGSTNSLYNQTARYINCVVKNLTTSASTQIIIPYYLCKNMKNCIEYNMDATNNVLVRDDPRAYWTSARQIGTNFAIAGIGVPAIAALTRSTIAYIDATLDSLRNYTWNGNSWALNGGALAIAGIGSPALTALNSTDVAFIDETIEELRKYRWSVNSWALVGAGLSIAGIGRPALAALNSTDVAFIDGTIEELRTYRWSTNSWALIGSGLSAAVMDYPGLAAMNTTDIVYIDNVVEELRIYRWQGSNWSIIGSILSIPGIGDPGIAAMNETDVILADATTDILNTYRFDGSNWSIVSTGYITGLSPRVAVINGTDIVYIDATSAVLQTYRCDYQIGNGIPYGRGDNL